MPNYVGSDVTLTGRFTDVVLPDGAVVTCTVTDPLGVASPVDVTPIGNGLFSVTVLQPGTPGMWQVLWIASTETSHAVVTDEFLVRDPAVADVISLGDIKHHLGMPDADSAEDDDLLGFLAAATEQIRDICGPVFPEQHTEWVDGGSPTVTLDWRPVKQIVAVTEFYGSAAFPVTEQPLGVQTSAFGFTADLTTGLLNRRTIGGAPAMWADGAKNVEVVYVAGMATVPMSIRLAALDLVQHWWSQMKQQRARGSGARRSEPDANMAYAVPYSVEEKLAPYRRPPGVA